MTDTSTVDEPEVTDEPSGDRPLAGAALQSALKKERKRADEAEKSVKDLSERLKAIEDQQLSETERLRNRLAEIERERDEERQRAAAERAAQQRTEMVRRAAAKENFADADDVVALLRGFGSLDDIEDESDANRAVKTLAKDKPHLLRKESAPDTSVLDRVLKDGLPPESDKGRDGGKPDAPTDIIPVEKLAAMSDEEQRALKASNPSVYWRSVAALNDGPATVHSVS